MNINVLWIEEEPFSVDYEMMLTRAKGWNLTNVDDVATALCFINENKYDLVIADLILYKGDYEKRRGAVTSEAGIEFIKEIRNPERLGATPNNVFILVISAVVTEEKINRVLPYLTAPEYFISKPIADRKMEEIIDDLDIQLKRDSLEKK